MKKTLLLILIITISVSGVFAQTILGIDVSSYQGTINWTSVKGAGYTFAWAKATEGITITDADYVTNQVNGSAAGVVMGAYHFAHPETNTATAEANYFLSVAGPYINSCSLPPVLDLEDPSSGPALSTYFTSAQLTAWVQLWVTTVQNATGITPIVYTDGNYAGYLNGSVTSSCGLWVADPDGSSSTPPATTGSWSTWNFKQYSWTTIVPGISGDVDMDVFNGNTAAFNILVPCVTTPCSHIYTTLPYSTSFENTWKTDTCNGGVQRAPDKYWSSNVGGTTPNGNDYWHRDDYTGADWTSPTAGAYTPVASAGSYSARFHNNPAVAGSTGAINLYLNLSAAGTKTIKFDYIHGELSSSPFSFEVQLSTDGGSTFPTTLLSIPAQVSSWTTETVTTTATSATSVIRFIATDKGVDDVGIDNLSITLLPTASYSTTSSPVCAGSPTTFTSTSTGSPTSYSWIFQSGTPATSTTSSQAVTYATAGTFTVSLTATNSAGSNTTTSSIVVNATPTVTATASVSTVCSGTGSTLTGAGGSTYSWNTGSTTNPLTVTPTTTTTYTVTGTNTNGCTNTATATITVNAKPTVTATASVSTVCSGTSSTLTGAGGSTYSWNTGSTSNPLTVSPTTTTTYTVTGTNSSGCTNTAKVTVTVAANLAVTALASAPTVCDGSNTSINASGATTYAWSPSTGLSSSSGATVTATPTSTTTYTVTGTNGSGCSGTTAVTVTVNPNPTTPTVTQSGSVLTANPPASSYQWYFNGVIINGATSQTYTATQNGYYTVEESNSNGCTSTSRIDSVINTGIAENSFQNSFNVYPNPNDGQFELNFSVSNMDNYTIEIHNAIGQLVYQEYLSNYSGTYAKQINLQNFGKGIYMLSLTNSHNQGVKKLIVF